jgi:hypothetical protein
MSRSLTDDVVVHEFPFSMLTLPLGGRSTLLRGKGGEAVVVSPGPMDAAFEAEIAKSEQVLLIAPNAFHHLYLGEAAARHPAAAVLGGEVVRRKRGQAGDRPLETSALPEGFLAIPMDGAPAVDETWIFHEASRTLVITDLAFNLQNVKGLFARWFFRWNQSLETFGPTKHGLSQVKDKRALRRSLDRVLELPVERLVVAHGDVIEQDAYVCLREGFARVR